MTRVIDQYIPPESRELFNKNVTVNNGFYGTKVDKKDIVWRKRNFEKLITQSVFPTIAEYWNALTPAKQELWEQAGYWSQQSGWALFAQDTAYRISQGIPGLGEPSVYFQYKVGHIHIEAPATSISIYQPITFEFERVFEPSINYISKLISTGAGSYARIYFNIQIREDGETYWASEDLSFYTNSWWEWLQDLYDWDGIEILQIYLSIEIHNMQGDLYFDGLSFNSNYVNFAQDSNCDNIEASWFPISVPTGASFESVYPRHAFFE